MESLAPEVAPFGIRTMLVEPGFFRTELLTEESTNYPESSIDDYFEKTKQTVVAWKGMNGLQGGDPAKLAKALVQLASQEEPPQRWPPVLMLLRPLSGRLRNYLLKPMLTGNCHRRSRMTKPSRTLQPSMENLMVANRIITQLCIVVQDVAKVNANWANILGVPEEKIETIFPEGIHHYTHGKVAGDGDTVSDEIMHS